MGILMKHFKKISTIFCAVLAVLIIGGMTAYGIYENPGNITQQAPQNIKKIAQQTLEDNRQEIANQVKEEQKIYCEPAKLTLGDVYNLNYPIGPKELAQKSSESNNFNAYLQSSEEWLFLVLYQNEPVSMISADANGFIYFGKNPFDFKNALQKITVASKQENVKLAVFGGQFYFVSANGDTVAVAPNQEALQTQASAYSTVMKSDKLCDLLKANLVDNSLLPTEEKRMGNFDLLQLYLS